MPMTMGIRRVAALAARTAAVPSVTITSTGKLNEVVTASSGDEDGVAASGANRHHAILSVDVSHVRAAPGERL